jgi:hypothetical protein
MQKCFLTISGDCLVAGDWVKEKTMIRKGSDKELRDSNYFLVQ